MKKIALLLLAVVATLSPVMVWGQTETRWGVTAGATYNQIHFKQSDILDVDRGFGPSVGVTGEMNIPGLGFSVDGSLLYTMRSSKIHYGDKLAWSSRGLGSEICRLHYLDVPLHLKLKWHKMNGFEDTLMPMVFVGPSFSFLVGKNLTEVNSYRPVSVMLHFGLGVELYRRVQVSAGYAFNIGETLRTRVLDENIAKNRCWNVSATYFFK
ncbi:MAG: PorT family protein [Muribaculaceae bacterium]|nr:PorT family protein [Muribaculaceae bacterium]